MAPSPDGRFLLTASSDQTIRIWDPERGLPLLYLFFAGEDWIAWTPEGYYAASPGGEHLMGWQVSNGPGQVGTFVPASQFHKSLYRPDVIKLLLSTGSVGRALEVLHERGKTVETVRDVLPPVIVITNPDRSGVRLDIPELEIRAVAKAQPGQPVTALRLIVDGRPFEGEEGRKLVSKEQSAERQVRESWKLRLGAGKHRLTVIAESAVSNGQSDEIEVVYEEKPPNRPGSTSSPLVSRSTPARSDCSTPQPTPGPSRTCFAQVAGALRNRSRPRSFSTSKPQVTKSSAS